MDEPPHDESPSASATPPEPEDEPIMRELERLREGARARGGTDEYFALLPVESEEDLLAFLCTVPTGTLAAELPPLARAWQAARPAPRPRPEDDRA
jgi:hypothetical protein